jgi:hypothetical protein
MCPNSKLQAILPIWEKVTDTLPKFFATPADSGAGISVAFNHGTGAIDELTGP